MKRTTRRRGNPVTKRLCGLAWLGFLVLTPRPDAKSPTIDVMGSYFPAWLLCIVVGLVLTIMARLLFVAWKLDKHLLPAPIVYPCLTAVFAMTMWLIFFRN